MFSDFFEGARAILYIKELLNIWFGKAISTSVYFKNGDLGNLLEEITKYEADNNWKSDLSYFHRLRSIAYFHNRYLLKKEHNDQVIKDQFLRDTNWNQNRL